MDIKQHWENIYNQKGDTEVSWFQEDPKISLSLIEKYSAGDKQKAIADIGGGNSMLVSKLVKLHYNNIRVMDISAKAIERSRQRILHAPVTWIESNVLEYGPFQDIDIWHDRAAFHFITAENDIHKYVSIVSRAIVTNGYLILGAFSETGPEKCSGLPVVQYSELKFRKYFDTSFDLVECFRETHITPFNTEQNFIWGVFTRK